MALGDGHRQGHRRRVPALRPGEEAAALVTRGVRGAGAVGQRPVEDLEPEVDVVGRDRERRSDPQHAAQPREPDDVDVEAELDAARRDGGPVALRRRTRRRGRSRGRRPASALRRARRRSARGGAGAPRGRRAGARRAPLRGAARSSASTVWSTARPTAAGSGSETCEVTWRKPLSAASCSIASVVTVAESGRPPPSVFESVRTSGTTSWRSNANSAPTRPSAVWASSRISSIPRSSHCSRRRAR